MNQNHSVLFKIAFKYCFSDSFVDYVVAAAAAAKSLQSCPTTPFLLRDSYPH